MMSNKKRKEAGYKIVPHMWTGVSEVQKPEVDK